MDLKKVTLPLSPEDMVEFFKDKDQFYEVDVYKTLSTMTERAMLLYISNLGLNCSFNYISPTIMAEYMVMKSFINSPMLTAIHANILYYLKYQQIPYIIGLEDFGVNTIISFIEEHQDLVIDQTMFLDSFLLYIGTRKEGLEYTHPKVDDTINDNLGFSIIKLITYEDFMIVFSREIPLLEDQTYYTKYFDDYMFQGKNLYHYANKSPLFGMVKVLEDEQNS